MLKNYLTIAVRNINRYRTYSFINIISLAIGMACTIFILLWVFDELDYDRFNEKADRIYRVVYEDHSTAQVSHNWRTSPPLGPAVKTDYPEILNMARFHVYSSVQVKYETNYFNEKGAFADPSIFDIFTFTFLKGNPQYVFENPYSVVITEEMAQKYFGDQDPINKTLTIRNEFNLNVTGVVKSMPHNSHVQFDFLAQFETLKEFIGDVNMRNWKYFGFQTFVLVPENIDIQELNRKISGLLKKKISDSKMELYLQPLTRIHLYDLEGGGAVTYVYIFSLIAIFVLIIACINFMNLSTARAALRAKEIGLRKVVGANRGHLIRQFLGESFFLSLIAHVFAIIMVVSLLPKFNMFTRKQLIMDFSDSRILFGLIGIIVFTGLLAGSYAALVLSSFQPAKILKREIKAGSSLFRKILVVFQFSIAIILIISTTVISAQLDYVNIKPLGFDKNNLVCIRMDEKLTANYESIKTELLRHSDIENVTTTSVLVGTGTILSTLKFDWEGNVNKNKININVVAVDYGFIDTFKMKMALGRNFSKKHATDPDNFIVNEEAIRQMGLDDPVGKRITIFGNQGSIIGVVKDFNLDSLHTEIQPMILMFIDDWNFHLIVRLADGKISSALNHIKESLQKFNPGNSFAYTFMEENLEKQYQDEDKLRELIELFAIIAIFVSCIGLFGLASFIIGRRTKEIGIRKVLGATVSEIVVVLSKDFMMLVLISNIIAWPVAYFTMENWLKNFAYRTNIGLGVLVFSALMAFLIALLTLSYQSIKAAYTNPASALKYE
jgi:ABC-type antimicrobial peptide transport system permease subunit